LSVPHPANGVLYLKLRDDTDTVQTLILPVMPMNWLSQTAAAQQTAMQPAEASSVSAKTQAAMLQRLFQHKPNLGLFQLQLRHRPTRQGREKWLGFHCEFRNRISEARS